MLTSDEKIQRLRRLLPTAGYNEGQPLSIDALYKYLEKAENSLERLNQLRADPVYINPRAWIEVDTEDLIALLSMIDIVFLGGLDYE